MRIGILLILLCLAGFFAAPAAQDAPPDSAAAWSQSRASWLSDRTRLREGDIVTVLIDEQTAARERVTRLGTSKRSLRANLSADAGGEEALGATGVDGGWDGDSRDVGEANRQGDLIGVLSARVIDIDRAGIAEIQGEKTVTVDGREQIMTLRGFVRPEDVSPTNHILSSLIADASISYKGKKIGAKTGIIGRILSFLWP